MLDVGQKVFFKTGGAGVGENCAPICGIQTVNLLISSIRIFTELSDTCLGLMFTSFCIENLTTFKYLCLVRQST